MVSLISLATLPKMSALLSLLGGHFGFGFFFTSLVVFAFLQWLGTGIYPEVEAARNWGWALALASIAGYIFGLLAGFHALLDLNRTFNPYKKSTPEQTRKRNVLMGKGVLIVVLHAIVHIPLELQLAGWPVWGGGLVTSGGIILVWIATYYLLRNEQIGRGGSDTFMEAGTTKKTEGTGFSGKVKKWVSWGNELRSFVFWTAIFDFVYVTIYWIAWAIQTKLDADNGTDKWLAGQYYFYLSIGPMGGLMIFFAILGYCLRSQKKLKYSTVPSESASTQPAPTPSPAGEPEVPLSTTGRVRQDIVSFRK